MRSLRRLDRPLFRENWWPRPHWLQSCAVLTAMGLALIVAAIVIACGNWAAQTGGTQ